MALPLAAIVFPDLSPVTFTVAGEPVGKGRARAVMRKSKTRGAFVGTYTPEKTRSYEGMVRHAAQEAMGERLPFAVPVAVDLCAVMAVPASWSQRKRFGGADGRDQTRQAARPLEHPEGGRGRDQQRRLHR